MKISRSEAKRLIRSGAFKVNGIKITDPHKIIQPKVGDVVEIGREAVRIVDDQWRKDHPELCGETL